MNTDSAARLRQAGTAFLATLATVVALVQLGIVWVSVCGFSTPAIIALMGGLAVGLTIAVQGSATGSSASMGPRILLTIAVLALCGMLNSVLDTSLIVGVSLANAVGCSTSVAFVSVGLVAAMFSWLTATWLLTCCPTVRSAPPATVLCGAACGCLIPLLNSVTVFPIAFSSAATVLAATGLSFYPTASGEVEQRRDEASLLSWVALIGFGTYCHAAFRMMNFLTPANVYLILLSAGMAMLLTAATMNKPIRKLLQHSVMFYGAILFVFMTPLSFGFLVDWNLQWNASVDSVPALMLWRAAQLATLLFMAGVLCRNAIGQSESTNRHQATVVPAVVLGICLGLITATAGLSVALQMSIAACLLALPLVLQTKRSVSTTTDAAVENEQDTVTACRIPPVAASAVMFASLLLAMLTSIDSAETSQRLFSARTANGLRLGLSIDVVDQSHCTRLLDQQAGATGDLTVWQASANLIELRRNGIPAGTVSTNEMTTPQPLAETLTAVLPLVMHPAPQHVLVLGDDSGVCTRVCCNSPIPFVEVVRDDFAVSELFAKYAWSDLDVSPMDDERVTMRNETVATAIRDQRSGGDLFDVVIAASPNPVTLQCQEQLTTQFYGNVKAQLAPRGIFCQRITQHDLGSQPILRILSSLSTVFERVVVVQISAGEMAMIAGLDKDSLLDSHVLDRLQRTHVTRELSRSGWDWSQVAALPVVDTSDPVGIYEHVPQSTPVSAESGYFALSLALESARWGNKPAELQQTFAPHQQRLADAAPRSDAYREYAIRYSAVVQQMEILSTFHDQPWAYRKSLKTEMMRNPRPAVEKIVDGGIKQIGDPRDEYRKDYMISLGKALQQAAEGFVDPLVLKELAAFTTVYEPLLSFFAHYELIRVHEATSHPGPALELRYRLHTIFFADGRDYSIRQIIAAMNQIVDSPELLPTPEARFDHLNAMLQELVRRWEGRRSYTPRSARQTQQEVDDCVKTANKAMDEMEKLTDSVDMSRRQFLARRKFITKALISPLRTYGEQVLAHRIKTEPPLDTINPWDNEDELPMLLKTPDSVTTN